MNYLDSVRSFEELKVLDSTGALCAKVVAKYDKDRKNFDDCDVILRTSVKENTINQVAEFLVGFVSENPEKYTSVDTTYKFAFPFYGGAVIEIKPVGRNWDDSAYMDMVFIVSLTIAAVVRKHLEFTFRGKEQVKQVLKRVDGIMQEILDAKCKAIEQDEVKLSLPGYDQLKQYMVER